MVESVVTAIICLRKQCSRQWGIGPLPFLTKNGVHKTVVPNAVDVQRLELSAFFPHPDLLKNPGGRWILGEDTLRKCGAGSSLKSPCSVFAVLPPLRYPDPRDRA
jgi:hypothetical protein